MSVKTGIEFNEKNGYTYVTVDGKEVAKMAFVFEDKNTIIINHTEVNPGYNGKGFGNMMLDKAVAFARENKIKIIPVCPFVKSVFDKTPDFRDVLK